MTGNIYRRRREYEQAAIHYEKALKQEPKMYLPFMEWAIHKEG